MSLPRLTAWFGGCGDLSTQRTPWVLPSALPPTVYVRDLGSVSPLIGHRS